MDKIYEILKTIRPENDYRASEDFIVDGLLDSFDIISLVAELENQFEVMIDALDILPENFVSAEAMAALVQKNGGTL